MHFYNRIAQVSSAVLHQPSVLCYTILQGWIQHDLVGGGGCSARSSAKLCWSCVSPAHQLASLLQSLASLLYLNCNNCCSQLLIIMLLLKLLYLILSLIIFCFIMKNTTPTPLHPLLPGLWVMHTLSQ